MTYFLDTGVLVVYITNPTKGLRNNNSVKLRAAILDLDKAKNVAGVVR